MFFSWNFVTWSESVDPHNIADPINPNPKQGENLN